MEKAIIDFLNRLYALSYDFTFQKKVVGVMVVVFVILGIIFEKQRKGINFNE